MEVSEIYIPVNGIILPGNLNIPKGADSIVLFSHGSGSSRFSVRNNFVAKVLNEKKIATLLIDLLTQDEDSIYENRFDIDLITKRLLEVTRHICQLPQLQNFSIGYFGASTGAASALNAAAQLNLIIDAVVSRGGRPDLAERALPNVKAPTLLIVGSLDDEVIKLNRQAYSLLECEKKMKIIEGASHLFEEKGKLEEVSVLATDWFKKYLIHHHIIEEDF
jgi:putative phosphoribosyl transferase